MTRISGRFTVGKVKRPPDVRTHWRMHLPIRLANASHGTIDPLKHAIGENTCTIYQTMHRLSIQQYYSVPTDHGEKSHGSSLPLRLASFTQSKVRQVADTTLISNKHQDT